MKSSLTLLLCRYSLQTLHYAYFSVIQVYVNLCVANFLAACRSPSRDKARLHGNDSLTLHVEQMIPGQYIFQLTARSSQGKKSSDQMTLTIRNGTSSYECSIESIIEFFCLTEEAELSPCSSMSYCLCALSSMS